VHEDATFPGWVAMHEHGTRARLPYYGVAVDTVVTLVLAVYSDIIVGRELVNEGRMRCSTDSLGLPRPIQLQLKWRTDD
jgi:hypothetical protein